MDDVLDRGDVARDVALILADFDAECRNVAFKKGIYIYGAPGCGKTRFVLDLLARLDYDVIRYDTSDVRNKGVMELLTSNNISRQNVLHMLQHSRRRIAIVMDEIDGMNNGDKGGITSLIKLIRQKKTKKQKLESVTLNPIICIGNYTVDKKIKELMKVCARFELRAPTPQQMRALLPSDAPHAARIVAYAGGDLRKLAFARSLVERAPALFADETFEYVFLSKLPSEDAKLTTRALINHPRALADHGAAINETDRTIVSLLYHENVIDALAGEPAARALPFYRRLLDTICFADYVDRITFQSQVWIFNELSSLMKTFHCNHLFHSTFPEKRGRFEPTEMRFTKILTKYSTEYNNVVFVYGMCQSLSMDRKDLFAFFQEARALASASDSTVTCEAALERALELFGVRRLDIRRVFRFLDKNLARGEAALAFGDVSADCVLGGAKCDIGEDDE